MSRGGICGTVVGALLLALTGLTGCGEDSGGSAVDPTEVVSPSGSSSETTEDGEPPSSDAPECSAVWHDQAQLPRSYKGCADRAGDFVPRDSLACSSGQRMIRYADRFYAVPGGTVHEAETSLDEDRDYRAAVRSCTA